jgi:3-deoxy-D-manno-octulosonic-acid transferase
MSRFAYRFVILVLVLGFYVPHVVRMVFCGRFKQGIRQRLGFLSRDILRSLEHRRVVWLHASAAGDVRAAAPIVQALEQMAPELRIAVSTTNEEGMAVARQLLPHLKALFYFPLDLPLITTRVLRRVRPRAFVMVEAELWPNFLYDARRCGVRTVVTNSTIQRRGPRPYRSLPAPFYEYILHGIDAFGARDEADRRNLLSWGIASSRIRVTGSSKFDQVRAPLSPHEVEALRARLNLDPTRPCLVAGCTHAGEEDLCLDAFAHIRREFPNAFLVVAPMDVSRAASVQGAIARRGWAARLWTDDPCSAPSLDALVVDTVGQLSTLYAIAVLAFVGGSFLRNVGGHNPWEPLLQGKPVCYGPHMRQSGSGLLEQAGAAFRVSDPARLAQHFVRLARGDQQELGSRIFDLVNVRRGAGRAIAQLVLDVLRLDDRNKT